MLIYALLSVLSYVAQPSEAAVATICLYNPTSWTGVQVVEVSTGSIGASDLLDWNRVRLLQEGKTIPFALKEGSAHWGRRFGAPLERPRAEDLLVFLCAVPPGEWVRVQVSEDTPGAAEVPEHVFRENGVCNIRYAGVNVAIDEASGQLRDYSWQGTALLTGPLSIAVSRLADASAYEFVGTFGPGYAHPGDPGAPRVRIAQGTNVPAQTRWLSSFSSEVMSQIDFRLDVEQGPSIVLTYRVYAHGTLEILADGQTWQGDSPWCTHAVRYDLPLAGTRESLSCLEDRYPFYGFKGYTASVTQAAALWRGDQVGIVEMGESLVNGRRWRRTLTPYPLADGPEAGRLVEALDEGLVVDVQPVRAAVPEGLRIESPDAARASAEVLSSAFGTAAAGGPVLRLTVLPEPASRGIQGDGFLICPAGESAASPEGWNVLAGTANGLYLAAKAVAAHAARFGREIPLIARNPVVPLRAGGFGGGEVEVDFPYGTEEGWKGVLENLITSGMSHFACLGMWGNWKMPVGYQYMPEIRSSAPEAYDESSGAKFAEIDLHRERALRLTRFLHDRGGRVWLWIPIGCVPTTYAQQFPEAMAPRAEGGYSEKIPCFTHPEYRRYLEAFFRELLETYPIDGLVLIRDDNGGLCTCARCKEYITKSHTKSPAWEQYLVIYDLLRGKGFKGDVAVYPYFDGYEPKLEPLLPKDLYVIGHGGEAAVLTRDNERIGVMGDTWLDNLYANFRLPPSPRMRRLISERGGFWIGGAYCGTELPWEAVGRFGWEPAATANTLRYEWGSRSFGPAHALAFVRMSQTYEQLWEINARFLPPAVWMKLKAEERTKIVTHGESLSSELRARLAKLKEESGAAEHARWFGHVELFPPFFEYHLKRLDLFARIYDLVSANQELVARGERLPDEVRDKLIGCYREIYEWAAKYDAVMQAAPEGMLTHCRWMTSPYKEFMAGYDQWLEWQLKIKQFAGTIQADASEMKAGQPFSLRIELHNTGVCPWRPGVGQQIQLAGAAEQLGLPKTWDYEGDWLAPGDRRTITLSGTVPKDPGEGVLKLGFTSPFRVPEDFAKTEVNLGWK